MGYDLILGTVIKCSQCGHENIIIGSPLEEVHLAEPLETKSFESKNERIKALFKKVGCRHMYNKLKTLEDEEICQLVLCEKCENPLMFFIHSV
jgi:hypothetical protein